MFQANILTDDHVPPLANGVLETLEKVGVLCENQELCRALERWGARVDYDAERVWFPRPATQAFVEALGRECATARDAWDETFRGPGLPGVGTQVAQHFHDYPTNETRSANRQDFITLTRLGSVLHPEQPVGHSLSMTDVPPLLEPLEAAMLLAEYATVPGGPFAWHVSQVDYLIEMGQVLGLDNWFTYGAVCFAHPLRFDRDTAAKFVRRVREGVPTGITAMPVAGVTTPVTVEGFVVVSSAEHLATWIACRAINPTVELTGSMWAGTVDMRSGAVSYSAPDAMFYAFAAVEFLRRWTGMVVSVGSGEYCDARQPGLYAALEKALKSMTVAAFTGQPASAGSGLLDEGKTLSAVQLLLDREVARAMQHLDRPLDPSPDNIALPTIREVGIGTHTSYMETEHTLRNFRRALWLPELISRVGWNGAADEAAILSRVQARVDALLASYEKPQGREEQLAQMRAIVDRARKELLAEAG